MRKFIVATEVYERYGLGEIKLDLYEVKDLDDLARRLEPDLIGEEEKESDLPERRPWSLLCDSMGDGMNYYLVKELVNGKLVEVHMAACDG